MTDRASIVASARAAAGNGKTIFGFIGSTEKGLKPDEYVMIPHGSTLMPFVEANTDDAGFEADFQNAYIECLFSDAARVATLSVDPELLPFVASNRAFAFAHGYLTEEAVVAPVALTDTDKDALITSHPHIAQAAGIKANVGTLATFITSACYWTTEHNTSGPRLPKGHYKAIMVAATTRAKLDNPRVTDGAYVAGHGSDKRLTLRSLLPPDAVAQLRTPRVFRPVVIADKDKWAKLRTESEFLPAGTAILGLLRVFLHEVGKCGLLGFSPAPQAVTELKDAYDDVKLDPCAYHGGAKYLFNLDPIAIVGIENLKKYTGIFGGFCQAAGFAISATAPSHIQELINTHKDPAWEGAGKLFATGAKIDDAKVKAAASSVGASLGFSIPDPVTDAAGYKTAADGVKAILDDAKLAP
jgi:hypothetical protein